MGEGVERVRGAYSRHSVSPPAPLSCEEGGRGGREGEGALTIATQFRRLHPYLVRRGWERGSRG